MFEPEVPKHQQEFCRLRRLQMKTAVIAFLFGALFGLILLAIQEPWTLWLMMLPLFIGSAVMGVLEVRKAAVFYRDLEDRERPPESSSG